MKNLIFLLSCFLALISCNRSDEETLSQKDKLIGTWEWISSRGGITGNTIYTPTPWLTKQINFTKDSLKIFTNRTLTDKYAYKIELKPSIFGGQKEIIVYSTQGINQSFYFVGNNLILNDECYDCFGHEYGKTDWECGTPSN